MNTIPANADKPLTRKEAAEYLTVRWFRVTVATLARYASRNTGPAYVNRGENRGGEALYRKVDLDQWAKNVVDCRPVGSDLGAA